MVAAPKFEPHHPHPDGQAPDKQAHVRDVASEIISPHASPAKALQTLLSSELTYNDEKYSPRIVTTLVIMFCASTWVGAFMLYSAF